MDVVDAIRMHEDDDIIIIIIIIIINSQSSQLNKKNFKLQHYKLNNLAKQ